MRWVLFVAISLASVAWAHDADVIYALVEQHGEAPNVLVETLTLTSSSLGLLAPLDVDADGALSQADLDARAGALRAGVWDDMPLSAGGARCTFLEGKARLRDGFVELAARFDCPPGELRQEFRVLRVLPPNYRVVLGSQLDGERAARGVAQGSFMTIPVPRPLPPGAWDPTAFQRAFDAGLSRGFALDGLACLAALCFALAAWRPGLWASALLVFGVVSGSFTSLPVLACTVLALIVVATAAVSKKALPVLGLVLGLALGAREGGVPGPAALGLATGTALLLGPASLAFTALGVMLARRARWRAATRWVLVAVAVIAAVARLS